MKASSTSSPAACAGTPNAVSNRTKPFITSLLLANLPKRILHDLAQRLPTRLPLPSNVTILCLKRQPVHAHFQNHQTQASRQPPHSAMEFPAVALQAPPRLSNIRLLQLGIRLSDTPNDIQLPPDLKLMVLHLVVRRETSTELRCRAARSHE